MTEPRRQRRRAIFAIPGLVALALAAALAAPTSVAAHDIPGIDAFLRALGQVESGGDYYAVNPDSGAYGKYQILPSNWPSWAEKYLGDRYAKPTPENQEIVAKGKVHDLYHSFGSWRVVAHWWLTGSSSRDESTWSSYSLSYVNKIMALYEQYGGVNYTTATTSLWRVWQEWNSNFGYTTGWSRAYHDSYSGDYARYTKTAGAAFAVRFTGTAFAWVAPKGPTRGKAAVYVDGTRVATVDLYSSEFRPREVVYKRWLGATAAAHTVRVVVAGTAGRPTVAVDAFKIRR